MDEPFRILRPGFLQGAMALFEHAIGVAAVDVAWGEHGDSGVPMFVVVPGKEGPAERDRGLDIVEAAREAGMVFQRFELGFGEGVVVADPGSAEGAGDAEVGEQLRGAFRGHGRAAVRVQGEHFGLDVLLEAAFLDEPGGERGILPFGDHPADRVSAEDVEQDVEVEVRPAFRSEQPGDVPGPDLVRCGGEEFGFGVVRMAELIAPFPDRLFGGQEAVHGAFRTQIPAFVEQRGDDFARRAVDEARGGEHVEDALALGIAQCPGGALAGLPGPGSGPSATVEGGACQAQGPARRCHADLLGQRSGGHQQFFPSSRFHPSSPATFPCTSMIVWAVASSFSSRATFASSRRTLGLRGLDSAGLAPRFFGVRPFSEPLRRALRQTDKCELYKPSRRSRRPISPGCVQRSASSRIRNRYSALNRRRVGLATTSGSGERLAGAAPALGASSLRSSTPRAGASVSLNIIESPLPLIAVHLHRPTIIPRVVDVSTMLAERERTNKKKLASVVADVLLARAEGIREKPRRVALSRAQRHQLLELAGTTPRCWLCGAEFSVVAVENFRFRRRKELNLPLYVDVLKPRGLLPRDLKIEADHVIPFSKGGGEGDNLRLACGWCNNHKSSYTSIYDVEGQPKALRAKLNEVTALPQPLWIVRLLATVRRCEHPEGCDQSVDNARMTIAPMTEGGVMNPANLRVTCYEHDPFVGSRLRPHSEVLEIWGIPSKE